MIVKLKAYFWNLAVCEIWLSVSSASMQCPGSLSLLVGDPVTYWSPGKSGSLGFRLHFVCGSRGLRRELETQGASMSSCLNSGLLRAHPYT